MGSHLFDQNEMLSTLGLSVGEAKVYLSLLKLGRSKVGAIANDSHVSYSKIYDVLNRLGQKGFVSHVTIGGVKHFNSLEPNRLVEYLERKEAELKRQKANLDDLIPKLAKLSEFNRAASGAEIFVGEKGIRTAYEVLLAGAKQGDVLRFFYPFPGHHEVATQFYSRLFRFQKSKKLEERGICTFDFKKSPEFRKLPSDVNLRYTDFPLPGTMDLFADKVLIVSWSTKTAILISSAEISEHFTSYFDNVWQRIKE